MLRIKEAFEKADTVVCNTCQSVTQHTVDITDEKPYMFFFTCNICKDEVDEIEASFAKIEKE